MVKLEPLEHRQMLAANDPFVTVTSPNSSASEPGSNVGIVVVARDRDFDDPLNVRLRISGAAVNGADYDEIDSVVTIPASQRNLRIRLTPLDDNDVEPAEGARFTLRTGSGYRVGESTRATIKIADDDVASVPPPTVTVTATDPTAAEAGRATGTFTIFRTGGVADDLLVKFHLSESAENGEDYDELDTFVVIPAGEQSVVVTIRPIDDNVVENTETVELEIDPDAAYVIGSAKEAKITIADNDEEPDPPPSSTITWTSAKDSPIRRFEAPSVVIDGMVYVFGGWRWDNAAQVERAQQRVDAYNPDTNAWTQRASLPTKLTHAAVAVDGTRVYFVGGFVGDDPGAATNDIWIYDSVANKWTAAGFELPEKLAAGGAAIIDDRLHFYGGSKEDRVAVSNKHWAIDLDNPAAGWDPLANMPNPRLHFSTAALNGKIYVFGGQHGHDSVNREQDDTAHVYNSATNAWTQLRDLPATLSHAEPGTFIREGRIIIAGGMTDTEDRDPVNDILEYDPETDTYRQLTPLPVALQAPVVQLVNGKLFVTSGNAVSGGEQSKSYIGTFS
jgi:N-acetylneuraminic acid mutarotase